MAGGLHGSARTTPRVRAELQASQEATGILEQIAGRLGQAARVKMLVKQKAAAFCVPAETQNAVASRYGLSRATEVDVAVHALNRMLELGRPISVRIA